MVLTVVAVCSDLVVVADSAVFASVADSTEVQVIFPKPTDGDGLSEADSDGLSLAL